MSAKDSTTLKEVLDLTKGIKDELKEHIDLKLKPIEKDVSHIKRKVNEVCERSGKNEERIEILEKGKAINNAIEENRREQKSFRLKTWHVWLIGIGLLVTIGTSILLAFMR